VSAALSRSAFREVFIGDFLAWFVGGVDPRDTTKQKLSFSRVPPQGRSIAP
jgi:hypothetical protein